MFNIGHPFEGSLAVVMTQSNFREMANIEITDSDIDALIDGVHPNEPVTAEMADEMAAHLQASPDNYDDGPVFARAIAVAPRRRAIRMRASDRS